MVIMNKPRFGRSVRPVALTTVFLLVSGGACSSVSEQGEPSSATVSSVVGGSSIPAAPATDVPAVPEDGSRNALVDDLAEAAEVPAEELVDSVTDEGTDSATTLPALPVDDATRAQLTTFGEAYLGYDHRQSPDARAVALEPLVTSSLLPDLAAPLPAALIDQLQQEERVVTPTLQSIEPLGGDGGDGRVFVLSYEVTTSTLDDAGESVTAVEVVRLTVVIDGEGIVGDVR